MFVFIKYEKFDFVFQIQLEPDNDFMISFVGTTTAYKPVNSTLGIDEIALNPGACHPRASCTFNEDTCMWYSSEIYGTILWERGSYDQISTSTRPYADNSFRSPEVS